MRDWCFLVITGGREETIDSITRTTETKLLVAALIVTVSFTAGFTLPGGLDQSPGETARLAVLMKKTAFVVFLMSDSIAFALSSLAVLFYFAMADKPDLTSIKGISEWANYLTLISLGSLTIAFTSGVYAVVSPSLGKAVIFVSSAYFIYYVAIAAGPLWLMWNTFYDTLKAKHG